MATKSPAENRRDLMEEVQTLLGNASSFVAQLVETAQLLLAAAKNGLAQMEGDLALIYEAHCELDDNLEPKKETLEESVRPVVADLERKIATAKAAIARAEGCQ